MTPEGKITGQVSRWLKTQGDIFFWKVQATAYSRRGIPDICGHVGGAAMFLEIKVPGNWLSPSQSVIKNEVEAAGGRVFVVRSLDDAKEAVRTLRCMNSSKPAATPTTS